MQIDDDWHTCHFCGIQVNKEGYEVNGERHFLSDCRPDLVEHEIGDTCTWAFRRKPEFKRMQNETEDFPENRTCYAYETRAGFPGSKPTWTNEHKYFYPDGPM